jgi:DNA-nicking Smr family endonuclease
MVLDEQNVLREAMSDEFDVSTLLDVDDQLSFRRPGIGLDVTRKLRGGHWSIQRQLDLHGLRSDEAREALGQFIRLSHRTGVRCVRIVHGKGLGSPGRTPVLKGKVQRWLVQKKEVLAFVQARPAEGGAGALVVLLQPRQAVLSILPALRLGLLGHGEKTLAQESCIPLTAVPATIAGLPLPASGRNRHAHLFAYPIAPCRQPPDPECGTGRLRRR